MSEDEKRRSARKLATEMEGRYKRNGKNEHGGNPYLGGNYYRRKRKRDNEKKVRTAVTAAVVILVLILGVAGAKKLIRKNVSSNAAAESSSTVASAGLKTTVRINDVDIAGMNREKAKAAVLQKYTWGMTAKLDGTSSSASSQTAASSKAASKTTAAKTDAKADTKTDSKAGTKADSKTGASSDANTYQISNLLEAKLNKILSEIYDKSGTPKESYSLDSSGMDQEIAAEVSAMAAKWNVEAKNGSIDSFDKASNTFKYKDSADGRTIDQNSLTADIRSAMDQKNYQASLTVKATIQKASLSADAAKAKYKVIGTFTTKATANADRNNNLKLACEAVDGQILKVGDEFSFNTTTGNRTLEKGYKPAGAYQAGKVVLEPGGGVCQVSSTLYNAVIAAGMTTTERHAHTFAPTYVTPGEDATVSYDGYAGPDMRFVNSTEAAIAIRASFYDQTVTVSIIGIPILEDGVTVSMHSEKTADYDNASIEYVEDPSLAPGTEVMIDEGTQGSRWVTNLVKKKNGTVISNEFFHDSTYKGHSKKIAHNTTGTQVTGATQPLTITENVETVSEPGAKSGSTDAGPGVVKTTAAASQTVASKTESGKTETIASKAETKAATKSETKSETKATETAAATPTQETVETVPAAPGN